MHYFQNLLQSNGLCPLCQWHAKITDNQFVNDLGTTASAIIDIECLACRKYGMSGGAACVIAALDEQNRFELSCYVASRALLSPDRRPLLTDREINNRVDLRDPVLIEDAIASFPKTLSSRLDMALINISRMAPELGEGSDISWLADQKILFSINTKAVAFILGQLVDDGLIVTAGIEKKDGKYVQKSLTDDFAKEVMLTAKGWNRIAEMQRPRIASKPNQAFVAMSFSDKMKEVYKKAIEPAIQRAGYESFRVDAGHHIGKIDDEIIARIRESKFVVADFTGQRGGVYYEAGFARGLSIPVISTCRNIHMRRLHFDTNHYNHLEWKIDDLDVFAEALQNRILANFDPGSNHPTN